MNPAAIKFANALWDALAENKIDRIALRDGQQQTYGPDSKPSPPTAAAPKPPRCSEREHVARRTPAAEAA